MWCQSALLHQVGNVLAAKWRLKPWAGSGIAQGRLPDPRRNKNLTNYLTIDYTTKNPQRRPNNEIQIKSIKRQKPKIIPEHRRVQVNEPQKRRNCKTRGNKVIMPCYYPVGTYRIDNSPCYRPCGRCIGCRLEHARQWAIRCVHEASMHEENAFITLTYNNENLPENGSLQKTDLQKFFKRLRRRIEPKRIRYYACGEYGERLSRPHYHACIFGHDFMDKEIVEAARGNTLQDRITNSVHRSKELEKLWTKGFSTVGSVTFESAGYCARYVSKKINGLYQDEHYQGKTPEFALMSRRPGIGLPWYDQYKGDVYPKDFFTMKGRKLQPPLYYDNRLKKENYEMWLQIKERRREYEERIDQKRLHQRSKHRTCVTKTLERRLENA